MSLLEKLESKATQVCPVVVYPEPEDERIVEAAGVIAERGIARPVLLYTEGVDPNDLPEGVEAVSMEDSPLTEGFVRAYAERRGTKERVVARLLTRPLVFAGMMVAQGNAGGMVAGIANPTASVIQAAGLTIGYREGLSSASSCFIMVARELRGESDVPLIFADCAVSVDPDEEELASIALASARSARRFLGVTPRVAMLSFSTAGSAGHERVDHVRAATKIAAERIEDGFVEGELQFDAAVNPDVAAKKGVGGGEVAGRANVLVFPDLDAANICYKAVREMCGARAIGPVLQGFARPVNDLSRSASVEDVVGTTVITALQAVGE